MASSSRQQPSPDPASSDLIRLSRSKRQTQLVLTALVLAIVIIACFDILAPADTGWRSVLYDRLYAVFSSLLASTIVTWVIFQQRIRDRQQKGRTILGLLGLIPSGQVDRVAIVVPAFPVPPVEIEETSFTHPVDVHRMIKVVPDNVLKSWREMQNYAYARRDMLLVLDLARLIAAAGLPPPHVVSDYDFLQAVQESAGRGPRSNALYIRTDSSGVEEPVRVTHVILIGLWSNLATMMLQNTPGVPIEVYGKGEEREVRLLVPDSEDHMLRPPRDSRRPAQTGADEPVYGVVARFHLNELTVALMGGTTAFATARLGDFVLRPPAKVKEIVETYRNDDLWLGIQCPPPGERWGPYAIWCSQAHPGYLAQSAAAQSLSQLFGLRPSQRPSGPRR